ncbi:hypothetical protein L6255_03320 [Candidatus Parcubacteria bacterium]|nr:hypothetical protein [Candidatus Parcubacteria bacterium]
MMSLNQNSTSNPQRQLGKPKSFAIAGFPSNFLIYFSSIFSLLLLVFMAGALTFPSKVYFSTTKVEEHPVEVFETTPPPAFGCDSANACCQVITVSNTPPVCEYLKASLTDGSSYVSESLTVSDFSSRVHFAVLGRDADNLCGAPAEGTFDDLTRMDFDYGDGLAHYIRQIVNYEGCTPQNAEDGGYGFRATPQHTYASGTYTATEKYYDRDGAVSNTCSITIQPQPKHYTCTSGACTQVNGAGNDECNPATPNICKHLTCQTNSCTYVNTPGANIDGCTTVGQQCGVLPKHYTCTSGACTQVNGAGSDECNPATPNICKHLTCQTNSCTYVNTPGANIDGCTTLNATCGETPPTVKSCETVTIAFVGGYDTHYVGDKVDITVTGKSDHANGVTSFKFRFGPEGSKVVTCGKFVRASMAENCSGISQDGDTYSTTLTYTLDKVGAFEVYGAACDDSGSDSCSEFSK